MQTRTAEIPEEDETADLEGELPQFAQPSPSDLPPARPTPPPSSAAPAPSQAPPPSPSASPPPGPPRTAGSTSSSTASFEAVQDSLGDLIGGLFVIGAALLNRWEVKRTKHETERWKPLPEEVEAMGEVGERVAMRHLPEELTEGETADALVATAVLLGYTARNVFGVTETELMNGATPAPQRQPPPPPQQAPPRRQEPRPAPAQHPGGESGIARAEPPPAVPGPLDMAF
jgi:hypothetical protein